MNASDVVFDTWAWWEILFTTETGQKLAKRYLEAPGVRIHTSAISFGEISAKFHSMGAAHKVEDAIAALTSFSDTHDVTPELAAEAGRLRAELRTASPDASLGDAIIFATSRVLGAMLVSADPAFEGQGDVVKE